MQKLRTTKKKVKLTPPKLFISRNNSPTNLISLVTKQKSLNSLLYLAAPTLGWPANLFNLGKCMSSNWLWQHYLRNVTGSFTGFQTNWNFINVQRITTTDKFIVLWRHLYSKRYLGRFYTDKASFLTWITQLTYFKDPRGLIFFVKKLLLNTQLKHHRRVFFFLNKLLSYWYIRALKFRLVKGYSLFFKGKLGKKGSVRKSKFFAKRGLVSFTKKTLRVNYKVYHIWTHTGVIGAGISIFY